MAGKYFTCRVQREGYRLEKMSRKHHQQQGKVTSYCLIYPRQVSSESPQTQQDLLPDLEAAELQGRCEGVSLWAVANWGDTTGDGEVLSSLFPLTHEPGYLECIFSLNKPSYLFPFSLFMTETRISRGHPTELLQPGFAAAALSNGNKYRVACEYRLLEKVPGLH